MDALYTSSLPALSRTAAGSPTAGKQAGPFPAYQRTFYQGPCAPEGSEAATSGAGQAFAPPSLAWGKHVMLQSPRGASGSCTTSGQHPGASRTGGANMSHRSSSTSPLRSTRQGGLFSTVGSLPAAAASTSGGRCSTFITQTGTCAFGPSTSGTEDWQYSTRYSEAVVQQHEQEQHQQQNNPQNQQQQRGSPRRVRASRWEIPCKFHSPIEKKIQQRLMELRRDPAQRQQLEEMLAVYQAEEDAARAARAAGIRSNKEEAVSLTAASRKHHIKQLAEARDVRLQQVLTQHEARQQAALEAKALSAHRTQLRREQRAAEAAATAAAAAHQQQVETWSGVVRTVSILKWVVAAAQQVATDRQQQGRRTAAALYIQRVWRGHHQRQQYQRVRRAVCVVQRAWKGFFGDAAALANRRRQAARNLLSFLSACQGVPHLSLAVKRVQRSALREARFMKQLYVKRTAQLLLLNQQWTALEGAVLTLFRKRAGADQLAASGASAAAAASKSTPRSVLADAMAARRKAAATDGLTEGGTLSPEAVAATAVSASSGGAAAVAGPAANSCKVNDRLVLDTLEPVTQHLKGLVLQAFIRAKVRAYALLLGRYWRDKAKGRVAARREAHLAAARAVLRGPDADTTAAAVAAAGSDAHASNSRSNGGALLACSHGADVEWGGPPPPLFRAAATFQEVLVLMQQGVAEQPCYLEHCARMDLVGQREALEQQLEQRRAQQAGSGTPTPRRGVTMNNAGADAGVASTQGSSGGLGCGFGSPGVSRPGTSGPMRPLPPGMSRPGTSGPVPPLPLGALAQDSGGRVSSGSVAAEGPGQTVGAPAARKVAQDAWQSSMLRRTEGCLRKRCQLMGTSIPAEMLQPAARRQNWDNEEVLLKKLVTLGFVSTAASNGSMGSR